MKELDARGLACPAPVLMTKDSIEKESPSDIAVIVDNEAASENVSRFLESKSYLATVLKEGSDFRISGRSAGTDAEPAEESLDDDQDLQKIAIMVTTDRMGFGDDALGLKLMINFLKTVREMGDDLWRLIFVNNGVKLTIEGAETLEALKELEAGGHQILVCGTCLDHFGLLEKKQVGQTTNMLDIVMAMQFADKVINL